MDKTEEEMARGCYGYGSWEAPYWFIGLEQGKGRNEAADNTPRINAWNQLGADELCDCAKFHRLISEKRWHDEARLQPTWRPLILLLMSYLGRSTDNEVLRTYQSKQWGKIGGETCVIELSGLAAKGLHTPMDRDSFRSERIDVIGKRLRTHTPELVVMYGGGQTGKKHWEAIAASALKQDEASKLSSQPTVIVLAKHPLARGLGNDYWEELGEKAKRLTK